MPLKVAANISLLFSEYGNMLQRYGAAKKFGFRWIESCKLSLSAFPYDHSADELRTQLELTGLKQILINAVPGDRLGLAGLPDVSDEDFRAGLHKTREYLRAMKCSMVHVMAGCLNADQNRHDCMQLYKRRLKESVQFFNTANEKIQVLIEPISYFVHPDYLLNDFNVAIDILDESNLPRDQLALQLNVFHLQLIHGDLTRNIKKFLPYAKHVQVAQTPNRTGLMDDGELNYPYILSLIENCGYSGFIGLEHMPNPMRSSEESLNWVRDLPQAEIDEVDRNAVGHVRPADNNNQCNDDRGTWRGVIRTMRAVVSERAPTLVTDVAESSMASGDGEHQRNNTAVSAGSSGNNRQSYNSGYGSVRPLSVPSTVAELNPTSPMTVQRAHPLSSATTNNNNPSIFVNKSDDAMPPLEDDLDDNIDSIPQVISDSAEQIITGDVLPTQTASLSADLTADVSNDVPELLAHNTRGAAMSTMGNGGISRSAAQKTRETFAHEIDLLVEEGLVNREEISLACNDARQNRLLQVLIDERRNLATFKHRDQITHADVYQIGQQAERLREFFLHKIRCSEEKIGSLVKQYKLGNGCGKLENALLDKTNTVESVTSSEGYSSAKSWYIMGGLDERMFLHYDIAKRVWETLPPLPWRRFHVGVCGGGNRLILMGGLKNEVLTPDIDEYDVPSKTWSSSAAKLRAWLGFGEVCGDGRFAYALGDSTKNVDKYCWKSKSITVMADMLVRRIYFAAALANNCIYAAGGCNDAGGVVEKYDISSDQWAKIGNVFETNRSSLAGTITGDDFYLMGGVRENNYDALDDVEIFNVQTGQSRAGQKLLQARTGCRGTTTDNGNVVCLIGGCADNGVRLKSIETFDKREGKWSTGSIVPDMPASASYFGLATV